MGCLRPGDSSFTAWGTHVRSSPGDAGTPAEKRLLLLGVILHAVNLKTIPRAVMDPTLGLIVHPFLHRRELSAGLRRVCKFLSDHKSEKLLMLLHDIKQELSYAALLLPLAKTNLRAQIDTWISATDATPSAGGAVSCTVSRRIAEALYRTVYHRGGHRRLDRHDLGTLPEGCSIVSFFLLPWFIIQFAVDCTGDVDMPI